MPFGKKILYYSTSYTIGTLMYISGFSPSLKDRAPNGRLKKLMIS